MSVKYWPWRISLLTIFQDHILVPLEFETLDGVPTAETIKQPGVLE
jgi:hypothetical protein